MSSETLGCWELQKRGSWERTGRGLGMSCKWAGAGVEGRAVGEEEVLEVLTDGDGAEHR